MAAVKVGKIETSNALYNKLWDRLVLSNCSSAGREYLTWLADKKPEEISFDDLKQWINTPKMLFYYVTNTIDILLENNWYHGEHLDKLNELKPLLKNRGKADEIQQVFFNCDCIDDIIIVNESCPNSSSSKRRTTIYELKNASPQCKRLISDYFSRAEKLKMHLGRREFATFLQSTVPDLWMNLTDVNEFNEEVFIKLINSARSSENYETSHTVKSVLSLYRFLLQDTDYTALRNARFITESFIVNGKASQFINDHYYFTYADPKNPPVGHKKVLFYSKEQDHPVKFNGIDFGGINSDFYRDLVIRQAVNYTRNISENIHYTYINTYRFLNKLSELKASLDGPASDESNITAGDVFLVKKHLMDLVNNNELSLSVANSAISSTARVLKAAADNKLISVDNLVFEQLRQFEEPSVSGGEPIPKEDLAKLTTHLAAKSKTGTTRDKLLFIIFRLAISTELRTGSIVTLSVNCIKPAIKKDEFYLEIPTKVTKGKKKSIIINSMSKDLILEAQNITATLRESASAEHSHLLFLYEGKCRFPTPFTTWTVSFYLKEACKEAGLENVYSACNLRDTRMHHAVTYISENNLSEASLKILTGHATVAMTLNHYSGDLLEDMLEATYNITIGDLSRLKADDKVVKSLPVEIADKAHLVENGAGACCRENCIRLETNTISSLPCFVCGYFRTTPKHKPYFERAIADIDKSMPAVVDAHDKSDLNIVKRVLVRFIQAIIEFEEKEGEKQ